MPGQHAVWTSHPIAVVTSALLLLGLGASFTGTLRPAAAPASVLGEKVTGSGSGNSSSSSKDKAKDKPPKEDDKKAFTIAGSVSSLYPGNAAPLVLTLSHENNFPIQVTALSVAVGNAGPGCPASNLSVSPYTGTTTIPANGSATKTLTVTLSAAAPDACQLTTWALTYSGTAVKP